jgi:hypothetical protein
MGDYIRDAPKNPNHESRVFSQANSMPETLEFDAPRRNSSRDHWTNSGLRGTLRTPLLKIIRLVLKFYRMLIQIRIPRKGMRKGVEL